jgi:catechol 2,3-dioxygenase-like lactoylglutathione lyase family enzyme
MVTTLASCISHVSLGTNDPAAAIAFYDRVLPLLGCQRIMQGESYAAYGKQFPEFWVNAPYDGKRATIGNGVHVGFLSPSVAAVHTFYDAALEAGARDDGAPGPRPDYGEPYYGCFVRDLDGNKIEAAYWDLDLAQKLYGAPRG